jgi:hypothetical protein
MSMINRMDGFAWAMVAIGAAVVLGAGFIAFEERKRTRFIEQCENAQGIVLETTFRREVCYARASLVTIPIVRD